MIKITAKPPIYIINTVIIICIVYRTQNTILFSTKRKHIDLVIAILVKYKAIIAHSQFTFTFYYLHIYSLNNTTQIQ